MQTRVKTKPTLLPVTLQEAKDELEIYDDDSINDRVFRLLKQATKQVEDDAGRVIMLQTLEGTLDRFPRGREDIEIREWPVATLTHVKYYTGGTLTTLSSSLYLLDAMSAPARVQPVEDSVWPTTDVRNNAVQLEWTAGYATQAAVPEDVKSTVLLALSHIYNKCGPSKNYDSFIKRIRISGYHH